MALTTKTTDRLAKDESALPPGLALMRGTTCFACHLTNAKSIGPAYLEVAKKYRGDEAARDVLAQKIISGGVGVWGKEIPMPPHPQHTLEQTRQMVDWVLALNEEPTNAQTGLIGEVTAPTVPAKGWRTPPLPVLQLTGSTSDNGATGVPPLLGETTIALHPHRKKAPLADALHDAEVIDLLEVGSVLRVKAGGHFAFHTLNLAGITHLTARVAPLASGSYQLEARLDTPDGLLIGSELIACMSDKDAGQFGEITFPITASEGVHHIVFVVRFAEKPLFNKAFPPPASGRILDVNWIEFRDNPLPKSARAAADGKPRSKVLLVSARQDHPWMSHMYSAVIELVATEHPILRGLPSIRMSDEIYRHTTLHPKATPLIRVNIRDRDDIVAWAYEREAGGRSFGTTLGHPWSNWQDTNFRRLVVQGIRWSLK